MDSDRIKWNQRFSSEESFLGRNPSPYLARQIEQLKRIVPGPRALDIACGEGRNSILLARHGFQVTGLDISDVGLEKARLLAREAGVTVDFRWMDLERFQPDGSYDLIINFNFLLRDLVPVACQALNSGGIFIMDTILESVEALAAHTPDYLLRRGELASLFGALPGEILHLEEVVEVRAEEMPTARVLFRKS